MSGVLKLKAGDAEDLEVISARLQDAVGRLKDFVWLPKERRFAVLLNRFRWEETKGQNPKDRGTRVRTALRFDGVAKVQSQNVKLGAPEAVVALLAIRFTPGEVPGGVVELTLAGGGAFRLSVECIDAELADLTRPWTARAKPDHKDPA
jgi:hypothetical protein